MFLASMLFSQEKKNVSEKDRMKPVLLVIDIQKQFKDFIPDRDREIGIYIMNAAIGLFRENGYPIVRVYHTDPKWGPEPGTEAFQFFDGVAVDSTDVMIIKNYPSSFKKTDLNKILKKMDRNTVFLCGLSSVGCVIATHFGAQDLDYNSFLIKEGIMSHNSRYTDSIEEIFEAIGYQALEVMLENAYK